MLTPLLLLWPISLALTWLVAQNIAGKPFDRALEFNVQALSKFVAVKDNQVQFNLTGPAREILRADDTDQVYYQVRGSRGEYLAGERDLPAPVEDEKVPDNEVRLREDVINGEEVRVAYTWIKVDDKAAGRVLVQVAETLEKRKTLATEIVKGTMVPQVVTLPLAVLLVWLALVRGIKPLAQLEKRIRARKPDDMSPLDESVVPIEVSPLVSSINDLLRRLQDSIATQKRFLADAAHQLKTPLAGLRMQADLALRKDANADDLKQSLHHIGRASIRATHTVNQLLALARAESRGAPVAKQACDLSALTMEVVKDCLPRAMDKHIDLGFDNACESAGLQGNPTLLKEMVRNLIENALNYTPSTPDHPGVVTARVYRNAKHALVLQVEDSGPGIAEAERERVFEPFYRVLGTEADGSGLGLPIVLEIAHKHGATVDLQETHPGHKPPGAQFNVVFAQP